MNPPTPPPAKSPAQIPALGLALLLALAPAVAIGFGRFAYALILPAMRTDLGWNFQQSGALNTANAIGYLLGAFLSAPLVRRKPLRVILLTSLAVSVGALWLAGTTRSFGGLLACRALVGASAAFTFIAATGLAARLGRSDAESATALGLAISGPGIGTALSGVAVPLILEAGANRWPQAWFVLGVVGIVAWVAVALGSARLPDAQQAASSSHAAAEKVSLAPLTPALAAYFLFGTGYIAYMTFLVAFVRSLHSGTALVASVWIVLGLGMVSGTWVWRRLLAQNRGGKTLALMGACGALAALLPYFSSSLPILLLSALLFGGATMPVFTAITLLIRRHLPPSGWTGAIAWATVIFAVGQSLGPLGSGALSDKFGPGASLWWSAIIMGLGALVALWQRPQATEVPATAPVVAV